jgi:Leucine-rich repeat (LRR) protein
MMKRLSALLLLLTFSANAQIITIPDTSFRNMLLAATTSNQIALNSFGNSIRIDANLNGEIEATEVLPIQTLNVSTSPLTTAGDIFSLDGIENFINLKTLNCSGNQLSALNLTALTLLEEIKCNDNQLATFNISGLANVKNINCNHNSLTSFSAAGMPNLETLYLYDNQITSLTFTNNPNLTELNCRINLLTTLDVSTLPALTWVSCDNNQLTNLTIGNLAEIIEIDCANNQLTTLDVSGLASLQILSCANNQIQALDVATLSALWELNCGYNPIPSLTLSGLSGLFFLDVSATLITTIDGSQTGITNLICGDNPNLASINLRNGIISQSDPDMLYYAFVFENLPALTSICLDSGEQGNLAFTNYNSGGNAQVFTGPDCTIPLPLDTVDFEFSQATIYPNPTHGAATIALGRNEIARMVTVFDILGQPVRSFAPNVQESDYTMDLSGLASGTYVVKIVTDSSIFYRKLLKK